MVAFLAACSSTDSKQNSQTRKANLLFILTDEQRYDTSAPYGNNIIKTPNLNKLGETGIVFRHAYVSQPVCSPACSTIMTGLYPHTNGVTTNNIPLDEQVRTLPEMVDSSYVSAFIGKWHLGRENDTWQGFDLRISSEDGYTSDDPDNLTDYNFWLREKGYEPDRPDKTFSRDFASDLPYEHSKSKFIEIKGLEFLEQHQNQPFLLYLSFLEPHSPNNGPFNDLHDPSLVELDSTYEMEPGKDLPLRYHMKKGYDYGDISTKELFARYWGLVHQVDLSVGKVLEKLDELGLAENTIVVFTSEHGKMMRKFGLTGKTVMYDVSSRVPWMMKVPGINPITVEQKVSQIDLLPTLLELLEQPLPSHLQGKSLVPLMKGEVSANEPVFLEWNPFVDWQAQAEDCPEWATQEECNQAVQTNIRTVVTQDGWKLNWSSSDKSQLFHLSQDPLEVKNLYYLDEYQEKIRDLKELILRWQETNNDHLKFSGV
jgi:arylsulfatase A-like enzyme